MPIRTSLTFLAAGVALACLVQPAAARALQVSQTGTTCSAATKVFSSIQTAVNAAFPGDKVQVCPGTYPEQVNIPIPLTLSTVPNVSGTVTVAIPSGGAVQNTTTLGGSPTAAQILAAPTAAGVVNVENIVVDGSGNNVTGCGLNLVGIYYQNAGGTIKGDTAQNQIQDAADQGCQGGLGILAESNNAATPSVTIQSNSVSNFQKNGITVKGTTGTITKNTVTGIGATPNVAQNGIEVGVGATAAVTTNLVSNIAYAGDGVTATGILVYAAGASTTVEKNTLISTQSGVLVDGTGGAPGALLQVTGNKISGSQYAGIGLDSDTANADYISVASNNIQNTSQLDGIDVCGDNNSIEGNKVVDSPSESAIHLDGECVEMDGTSSGINNDVESNKLQVACVGILSGPAEGQNNIGLNNTFKSVTHTEIFGQDSYSCNAGLRRNGSPSRDASAWQKRAAQPFRD